MQEKDPLAPIVWIDLETGGTDPRVHQITQVAAIATTGTPELDQIGEPFERKVCLSPGHFTQEALQLQNYGKETWDAEAVAVTVMLQDLIDWCKPYKHTCISASTGKSYSAAYVAGYNVDFDCRFLRAAAERNDKWLPLMTWTGGYFDVLQLLRWMTLFNGDEPKKFQLRPVCEHFGLPAFGAHDACEDIRQTIKLARCLIMGF